MKKLLKMVKDRRELEAFAADNRELLIKTAAAVVLVAAAFFIFLFNGEEEKDISVESEAAAVVEEEVQSSLIYVDIGGEVINPMVAELEEGSRVEDAIEAAGGVTDRADLTDINRAAFVEDGEKIFIPAIPELTDVEAEGTDTSEYLPVYSDDRVNINTADSDELQQLSGIGPVTAEKIIAYREENGRFSAIEDIMNVSGIGEKTFEKFSEDIKV